MNTHSLRADFAFFGLRRNSLWLKKKKKWFASGPTQYNFPTIFSAKNCAEFRLRNLDAQFSVEYAGAFQCKPPKRQQNCAAGARTLKLTKKLPRVRTKTRHFFRIHIHKRISHI